MCRSRAPPCAWWFPEAGEGNRTSALDDPCLRARSPRTVVFSLRNRIHHDGHSHRRQIAEGTRRISNVDKQRACGSASRRSRVREWRRSHNILFNCFRIDVDPNNFAHDERVFFANQQLPHRPGCVTDKIDDDYTTPPVGSKDTVVLRTTRRLVLGLPKGGLRGWQHCRRAPRTGKQECDKLWKYPATEDIQVAKPGQFIQCTVEGE